MTNHGGQPNGDVWVKQQGDSPESSSYDVTNSQSQLLQNGTRSLTPDPPSSTSPEPSAIKAIPNWKKYAGVIILTFINLLNYMDRFTIAGVLMEIKQNFQINNAQTGLLQTVFIISYMLVAPLFGYLGDRFNRIWIMAGGMMVWSGFTLLSSFIHSPDHFVLFLLTRALVGIGEASYATIAPTLIGDMFVGPKRTQMLSVFFFATPIGSGLGFIVGAAVAQALGGWEWALRVTPVLGVVAILLLILLCPNPVRGASETSGPGANVGVRHSYCNDLHYLTKNRSFIWVSLGFTFMAFVIGSLTLWGPTYIAYSQIAIGALPACQDDACENANISFVFGVITCVAGFAGVGIGAESARRWKMRGKLNADALVCAIGLLVGAPLLFFGVQYAQSQLIMAWILIFFADLSLCMTWTLISDMTLYVTEPNRRSTANAVQLLFGHLFGDAGSPYLLGVMADALAVGKPDTYMTKYTSMQMSMYITLFACIVGAVAFFIASFHVVNDKKKVDNFLRKLESSKDSTGSGSVELDSRTCDITKIGNGNNTTVQNQSDSLGVDYFNGKPLLSDV